MIGVSLGVSLVSGHLMMGDSIPMGGRPVTFESVGSSSQLRKLDDGTSFEATTETFRSSVFSLHAGEVAFSNPYKTVLQFPKTGGDYMITKFQGEVVDANGVSVPLDEVYLHHWLIFNEQKPNLGVCGGYLKYNFGIGAESRGTPVEYPSGYGWRASSSDTWGMNLHILRTQGLKVTTNHSQAVKQCIECWPDTGKSCSTAGFDCCQDGSYCPVDGSVTGTRDYYFQYKVEYTTSITSLAEVHAIVLDASNCQVETNIKQNDLDPWSVTEYSWKSPVTANVVLAIGHLHNGAKNVTLYVNDKEMCTTTPRYGTEVGVAGNEKGYLVEAPGCVDAGAVKAGDKITVRSHYWVRSGTDPTGSGLPGGFHGGVMSYFYLVVDKGSLLDREGNAFEDFRGDIFASLV